MFRTAIRARNNFTTTSLVNMTSAAGFYTKEKPLVTITGFEGFLGSHTGLEFLKNGSFRVRGTIRKSTDMEKLAPIKAAYGEHWDSLELVQAELLEEGSMEKAIQGSTYVAHLASPFLLGNKTLDELVQPAVDGTSAVMKACHAAAIKRCVITSSIASVRWMAKADTPKDEVYDESCWSNPNREGGMGDYAMSKILAERLAWDYQASNGYPFELVTICPTLMMGPGIVEPNSVS